MEDRRIDGIRQREEFKGPSWLSRVSRRQVLTRNTACKMALNKFSQQLDRERKMIELHFENEKEKLSLLHRESCRRDNGNHRKRSYKHNLVVSGFPSKIPGKYLNREGRAYCRQERSRLELNHGLSQGENQWMGTVDASLSSKDAVVSITRQSAIANDRERYRARDDGVKATFTEEMSHRDSTHETKNMHPIMLSHILPPLLLPPIYEGCMRKWTGRKEMEHVKNIEKGCVVWPRGSW